MAILKRKIFVNIVLKNKKQPNGKALKFQVNRVKKKKDFEKKRTDYITYLTDLHLYGLFSAVLISQGTPVVLLGRVFPGDLADLLVPFFPSYRSTQEGPGDQCVQVYREDLVGLEVPQNEMKINK